MAYLKGERSSRIDTSLLYVNNIVNNDNDANNITISARTNDVDENGEYTYNTQVTIDESGVKLENTTVMTTANSINDYIIISDTSINDPIISSDNDYKYSERAYNAVETMKRALDSSSDLIVKVKNNTSEVNHLYIDPASPIFTNDNPSKSLSFLLDEDSNINYRELIPYLVAKIQTMSVEIEALKEKLNIGK